MLGQSRTRHMNIPDYNGKAILIVEDDAVSQELLKELLQQTGAELIFADDGASSIALFEEFDKIDLVLMDVQLPLLSGTEAMEVIKKMNPEVPIIAQTAFAMASDKGKYLSAGFDNYIPKPLLPEALYKLLNEYLS